MSYHEVLGLIAVIIGVVSYIPYIHGIFTDRIKPHAFSWFVWATLTGIAFAAQVVEQAGPGAWVTGITAAISLGIFVAALMKGTRDFSRFDWFSLAGAGLAMILWAVTSNPLWAAVLVTLIDAIAFLPTFRKGWALPFEDGALTFGLSSLKFLVALFALQNYSLTTWLYPASLVIMNAAFVGMLVWRRTVTRHARP